MFVRSWLRAALGAGGILLVVPVGLVMAVVLAAAVGGSSLNGLGQVFAGPSVPGLASARTGVTRTPGATSADDDVLAIPARARSAPAARRATGGRTTPAPPKRRPAPERPAPAITAPAPVRPAPAPTATTAAPTTGTTTPPPASTPAPAAPTPTETNPVRAVAKVVTDTVRPVLPPVTSPAADAVGSVVDLLAPPPR